MAAADARVHLFAGGCGGTLGAVLTCPLEVVKTRLQSSGSLSGLRSGVAPAPLALAPCRQLVAPGSLALHGAGAVPGGGGTVTAARVATPSLAQCLRTIVEKEGVRSLFRGLGPNLVGVAPSRAIYFAAYSSAKEHYNSVFQAESPPVHMCSAATAGFTAISATNPIWLVKTRMQLESRSRGERGMTALQCVRKVYRTEGVRGFYRGMTASYAGISETIVHFVLYESLKRRLLEARGHNSGRDGAGGGGGPRAEGASRRLGGTATSVVVAAAAPAAAAAAVATAEDGRLASDFLVLMCAAACSKACASCLAYPHEVARTRLREEGTKYRSLVQTLRVVAREEGGRALYRGLPAHLLRQVPNTAIMMATYEVVVYLLGG
ncbi:solute carrier family 25 member 36-like isoform X2 [Lethenteron reissneri]|uniref:solute carrier family 25 member 36-like isoform X2 n=1 Tax=Lethenteron reissneri TaxID=7753 RepID=UPI002AB61436|nr:solute carrier family 25 member 36-like isoform X2 [Lethenteron reissneri]